MKFVISIMFLSLLLIGVLVAVAFICDRLKIGTQTNAQASPTIPVNSVETYCLYQNDYEYFGDLFWHCLQRIQDKCGLEPPNYVSGIYCEDINVCVGYERGRLVFRYEVPRKLTGLFEGGGRRIRNEDVPADRIAKIIDTDLPHYVSGKFSYTPPVNVFDISRSRVRVEIVWPVRMLPVQGGFQI